MSGMRNQEKTKAKRYCIYGARAFSISAYVALRTLHPEREIACFLVTNMAGNPEEIDGLSVSEAADYASNLSEEDKEQTEVIIAAAAHLHEEITAHIESLGFMRHSALDEEGWGALMEEFYRTTGKVQILRDLPLPEERTGDVEIRTCAGKLANLIIYMARHVKDRPIVHPVDLPAYITPVQVGAALTTERICEVTDDKGDNISSKNVNYCELTALYYAWKNRGDIGVWKSAGKDTEEPYYGLAHYRRFMELSEKDLQRIIANDVDVILPYPFIYHKGMEIHHHQFVKEGDWNAMLQALQELGGERAALLPEVLQQPMICLYNIVCARAHVMDDYCAWLFPILARTEELSDPKGWERADRYIGYMGETLLTLYLYSRRNELKMAHTRLRFLV